MKIFLILIAAALPAWSQTTPTSSTGAYPAISEIAASYTNFQKITKDVVFVNPELAMLPAQ